MYRARCIPQAQHVHGCGHTCTRASCPHIHFSRNSDVKLIFFCDACEAEIRDICDEAARRRDQFLQLGQALLNALKQSQNDDPEMLALIIPIAICNATDTAASAERLLRERVANAQLYGNDPNRPARTCYEELEFDVNEMFRLIDESFLPQYRSLVPQGDEHVPENIIAAWKNSCNLA